MKETTVFAVMLVLDNPSLLDNVLDAWQKIGVRGVTIFESTGYHRVISKRTRIPARFRFASFTPLDVGGEDGNYTLLTMVDHPELIERCVEAAESVVGNLDDPNTGILAAWQLHYVKGLPPLEPDNPDENG